MVMVAKKMKAAKKYLVPPIMVLSGNKADVDSA